MEFVFVVPRARVFPDHYPQGFVPFGPEFARETFEAAVLEHGFFVERERAEITPEWKQVIPYTVVLSSADSSGDGSAAESQTEGSAGSSRENSADPAMQRVLLLKRLRQGGEARLHDKLSIGVGGHINPEDLDAEGPETTDASSEPQNTSSHKSQRDPIAAGTHRELAEELDLTGSYTLHPVGIINDDANAVGAVHVGYVQVLTTDGRVAIREREVLEGELLPPGELSALHAQGANFESWSAQLVERWSEIQSCASLTPASPQTVGSTP